MRSSPLNLTPTVCCICGTDDATRIGVGFDYEYRTTDDCFSAFQCRGCSLVYLNPRPTLEDMATIYPSDYHAFDFSKQDFGFVHRVRSRLEAKRLLAFCGTLPEGARLLDVGCGDGFHLRLLREYSDKSWQLEGVDLDDRAVEAAEKSGLKVHYGSVETLELGENSYDLVFMIQTIEHVERPDEIMAAVFDLLKPGGKLVVVTDNTDSVDFSLFKSAYWGGYHFPRHLNLFNRNSLTRLAANAGFTVEKIKTLVTPVNWVYSFHNALTDRRAPAFLVNRFTLKSVVSLSAFTVLDVILQKARRGGLLQATLSKPTEK